MQLNKTQALFLSKILFNYKHTFLDTPPDIKGELEELLLKLESFLTGEEFSGEYTAEDEEEDEEDDDEEDDGEPEPQTSEEVKASDLHDLSPALQISTGELEFECDDEVVDVLINGYAEVADVSYVVRKNDSLKVWENGCWHTWQVVKTPKAWKKLKNDVVYKVVAK